MQLRNEQVHVWLLDGAQAGEHAATARRFLSEEEQARAARFRSAEYGVLWSWFRAGLREILAQYVKSEPAALEFQAGAHGKPALDERGDCALYFNLSHAGQLALVAVTRCAPVGVDLEYMRELSDREALVKRFFSAAEQAAFNRLPAAEHHPAFYRIWTRKEALIKANGIGLSAPLDAFDVDHTDVSGWRYPAIRPPLPVDRAYPIHALEPGDDYQGAVALEIPDGFNGKLPRISLRRYSPVRLRT